MWIEQVYRVTGLLKYLINLLKCLINIYKLWNILYNESGKGGCSFLSSYSSDIVQG